MSLFDEEYKKEQKAFVPIEFKNQRRNVRKLPQVGKSNFDRDVARKSLVPGKRISKSGKTYWETRRNRSDSAGAKI